MKNRGAILCAIVVSVFLSLSGYAHEDRIDPIKDNSFLVEEAYNQEPGVVHHISTWMYIYNQHDWLYTFTQEWPVPGMFNQLSYTIPVARLHPDSQAKTGLGDILLNYRMQALAGDVLFIAPRLSLVLPTGDYRRGLGTGSLGLQFNIPVSVVIGRYFEAHFNAGMTFTPHSSAAGVFGERYRHSTVSCNFGGSLVFIAHRNVNLLLEGVYLITETVSHRGGAFRTYGGFVNPGIRFAINHPGGLQIVPGIAFPVGFGSARGDYGFFVYLSFEHILWHAGD